MNNLETIAEVMGPTIDIDFVKRVRDHFAPYYLHTDKAHLIGHADDVCYEALRLATVLETKMSIMYAKNELSRKVLVLAAYAHDMFTMVDREQHHVMAAQYLKNKEWACGDLFTDEEISQASRAAESHRASWGGRRREIHAVLFSVADRGVPNYERVLYRSYLYGLTKLKLEHNEAVSHAHGHIVNKYCPHIGYAKHEDLYAFVYSGEVERFNVCINSTTLDEAFTIVHQQLKSKA